MNSEEFLGKVEIGNIVQVVWKGATFDPDAVLKPGDASNGLSKVYTCGFIAFIGENKEFITVGIDSMFEAGNKEPSFRSLITIPTATIESAAIYGKVAQ